MHSEAAELIVADVVVAAGRVSISFAGMSFGTGLALYSTPAASYFLPGVPPDFDARVSLALCIASGDGVNSTFFCSWLLVGGGGGVGGLRLATTGSSAATGAAAVVAIGLA